MSALKGAGAILKLPLVYSGWKFKPVLLTECDERHLFDLEVRSDGFYCLDKIYLCFIDPTGTFRL